MKTIFSFWGCELLGVNRFIVKIGYSNKQSQNMFQKFNFKEVRCFWSFIQWISHPKLFIAALNFYMCTVYNYCSVALLLFYMCIVYNLGFTQWRFRGSYYGNCSTWDKFKMSSATNSRFKNRRKFRINKLVWSGIKIVFIFAYVNRHTSKTYYRNNCKNKRLQLSEAMTVNQGFHCISEDESMLLSSKI